MKRAAILTAGLMFLQIAPAGAFVVKTISDSSNQNPSVPAVAEVFPANDGNPVFTATAKTKADWFGANQAPDSKTPGQKSVSQFQSNGNSEWVDSPRDAGGITRNFSASEPVASSSGPAPTEAPMPRAGWIGLAGVLGVIAARSFSAAKRSRHKSAAS